MKTMSMFALALALLAIGAQAKKDPLVGKEAPELEIAEWIGDGHSLKDLRGKVVVLEFFQMI